MIKKVYVLFVAVTLISCSKSDRIAKQSPTVHYEIGNPYPLGEQWFYPEENFAYNSTGLASVSSKSKGELTANGEIYNPESMTGGHPTLQLPSIVQVKNLDNGKTITIRLNDRIHTLPARLLELTPKAAHLLNMDLHLPAKVEVTEVEKASQKLAFELPNGPQTQMQVQTAPLDTIKVENLDGFPINSRPNSVQNILTKSVFNSTHVLPELPAIVTQGSAIGGDLWIEGGSFTSRIYARRFAARMNGKLITQYKNGKRSIRVLRGPYQSVNQADQDLNYLIKSGIKGAKIIVE
ncbi:Endolytic peptidoglycan transglycosylase RlpA [Commensalibacter sp. Nvir]|uniref:septal ring lytic transglycosylase RlpA family protein n=1 Tax=Commensalibacter sp. Nvir TaxID=3069817 RepID=UPI002D491C34|nr:Endolytic peptidoglycan transglycosylase RlpA [Commensalibacter sp. Nvir]